MILLLPQRLSNVRRGKLKSNVEVSFKFTVFGKYEIYFGSDTSICPGTPSTINSEFFVELKSKFSNPF